MSIEKSTEAVTEFLKTNQDLIKEITQSGKDSVAVIQALFKKLETNRQQAEELITSLNQEFQVAALPSDRQKQQEILEEIDRLQDEIETFKNSPAILAPLYGDLSMRYLALANTFNNTAAQFVTFTDAEVKELKDLMRQATLDTAARQRWADILDASVRVAKIALKVAVKLAA